MKQSVNFPIYRGWLDDYGSLAELVAACTGLGLQGIEPIWGDTDYDGELPTGLTVGYHLLFWPDWLDFWLGDRAALDRKFGSRAVWTQYYGGEDRAALLRQYQADMERAAKLGAAYVVLHVSDVSIEEGYTYRWLHTNEAVIDAACELVNQLTADRDWPFDILLENQWWPGFTFTDPALTQRLLAGIHTPKKGLLLDTGHLLNTALDLADQRAGIAYIHEMLDAHGPLCREIKAVHLHQSLSGAYVRGHTGSLPAGLPVDYWARYAYSYDHVLQIDRHQPWTEPEIAGVLRRLGPQFLTHELSAASRTDRKRVLGIQLDTLRRGGLTADGE